MFNFIKRHKVLSAIIGANIVAIIIVIGIIISHYAKTATIDIKVAPIDATIKLNGQQYNNLSQHDIVPGHYHIEISMDNMQPVSYDINLEKNGFANIYAYLKDTNDSYDYYLSHPEDEFILEEVAPADDAKAQVFIKNYKKIASLKDHLPIDVSEYTEDFAYYTQYSIRENTDIQGCDKVICIIIEDNTGDNEEQAKKKIQDLGFNLADYRIDYEYNPIFGADIDDEVRSDE
ncbi:hypothetical protein IKF87_02610 [Candidatus Saccharibacteria bacterium]|nr:hypothetical protein [Candidatus Saccharibacteria bacterium]